MEVNKIYQGNCLEVIKTFPDESIDCCVTSPPYYALRDYQTGKWEGGDPECSHMRDSKTSHCNTGQKNVEGSIGDGIFKSVCPKCGAVCVDEQIGLEESPEAYIEKLVVLSREVRRILKPTGTLWLNLGDSYQSGNGKVTGQTMSKGTSRENAHVLEKKLDMDRIKESGLKQKDLIGIPWMAAFALRKDGWYLRQEIIWAKGSCMPECLIPSTSIFIKQEGLILKRNLQFIYDNKNKLGNIEILSPSGWKKILNVWETEKQTYSIDVSNIEKVICSPDHKFPICGDVRRSRVVDKKVTDIRNKNDWMVYKTIESFMVNEFESLDVVKVMISTGEKRCFIQGDSSLIKSKKPRSLPLWKSLANKFGYECKEMKGGYETPIKTYMLQNLIPCDIAVGENFNYQNCFIISPKSNGKCKSVINLDYNMGYLIGLYIAEGGFVDEGRRRGAGKFTFHIKEENLHNFIIEELNKLNIPSRLEKKDNYASIHFNSLILSSILRYFCTGKCKYKKLNLDYILNTNKEFRRGILEGAIAGDGSDRPSGGFSYTSSSEQLIDDMKTLGSSLGIVCAKIKNEQLHSKTNKIYISWIIYTPFKDRNKRKDGNLCIFPREIKDENAQTRMIDIEVEDHLFIIGDGLVSHNSVTDRCTKSHEHIFLLSKESNYYFDNDSIKEPSVTEGFETRNKRSVWSVNTKPFKESHFATFPTALIEPMIKAGVPEKVCSKCGKPVVVEIITEPIPEDCKTYLEGEAGDKAQCGSQFGWVTNSKYAQWIRTRKSEKKEIRCECGAPFVQGVVLDPFMGAGTTAVVAKYLKRSYVGIDLNPDYIKMAEKRIANTKIPNCLF